MGESMIAAKSDTLLHLLYEFSKGFPSASKVKNLPANAGDAGSVLGLGRCPGEGNGNPLQYSCLVNPNDRGACQIIVHRVAKDLDMV